MEAIIVPCTQEKVWDTEPTRTSVCAKDAYRGRAFATWRSHAEQAGCPWFILSTKYGLLLPEQPIEPYTVPVSHAAADAGYLQRLAQQGRDFKLATFDRIILLDWERFEPLVRAAIGDTTVKCALRHIVY